MSDNLYLFTGPEIGLRSDEIEGLKRNLARKASGVDYHLFYANETPSASVVSLLMNGSLFSDAKFVVFANAELIKKKEDIEVISEWKKTASDESVLVLVSDEIGVDKKLEALVSKDKKKIFWELFDNKKTQWVTDFFKRQGYSIEPDAVETILELVENNTAALAAECGRFFVCFDKSHTITEKDADSLLSHNREESPFTLFDALAGTGSKTERLENALEILQKIRLSKDSSGVQLIAGLTYCFRKLSVWHALQTAGSVSPVDLKSKGFASSKMQEQYRRAARIWNTADCKAILALLAGTDMQIRSDGTALEENALQTLIYLIVQKNGQPAFAYETD
ncbi:MAG: DNA polymerase III subunit delta [Spirochaetaceae bacterium]|nr:DNA polymerase III subunit delta [Spirochaetaceae bacterium]